MTNEETIEKYLPLSESTYYIMLVLVQPIHGYGIMQKVESLTNGEVSIGPGTLYGAFTTLEKESLISMVRKEDRRKYYVLTEKGRVTLRAQMMRLKIMMQCARQIMAESQDSILIV